jgi:hypothetical protein
LYITKSDEIAGEQRWRAALAAELPTVPVRVFDADEHTVDLLRLEENLRRRTPKPSEAARAVKRWYELRGIAGSGRVNQKLTGLTFVSELAQ